MRPIKPSQFFVCLSSLALVYGCSVEDPFEDLGGTGGGTGDSGGGSASGGSATGGGTQNSGGLGNTGGGSTGGGASGGAGNSGGGPAAGGAPAAGGGTGDPAGGGPAAGGGDPGTGGAPDVDEGGKMNAVRGESTNVVQDYLRLGEIRILNNNWGSAELGCNAPTSTMDVFVDNEGKFGWNFNRGDCAYNGDPNAVPAVSANTSQPDFPQVEFGVHPFGIGSDLATSPEFSSTTLLPLQLKDITSASVTVDQSTLTLGGQSSWNTAMEFWLSDGDPRLPNGQVTVHTEVMAWWGWNGNRWPCGPTDGSNGSEGQSVEGYTVCHQSETWAGNKWRYYQFRAGSSSTSFSGKIDVGAFLDYLRGKGYSGDLWLTRMEVGTEIDDMTDGTFRMNGITFEVNGESRSAIIGE